MRNAGSVVPVRRHGIGVRRLSRDGARCNGSHEAAVRQKNFLSSVRVAVNFSPNLSGCRMLNYTVAARTRCDGDKSWKCVYRAQPQFCLVMANTQNFGRLRIITAESHGKVSGVSNRIRAL
jgi:hypothetical protein